MWSALRLRTYVEMYPCAVAYSEILLVPKAMYTCPFLGSPNLLVLAEAYQTPNDSETPTNGSDLPALQPVEANTRHAPLCLPCMLLFVSCHVSISIAMSLEICRHIMLQ